MMKFSLFIALTFTLAASFSAADELDAASQEALQKTQDLLKNSKERNEAITNSKDKKATDADNFTKGLTGNNPALTDEIYKLAAEVFAIVVKDANGDPEKMKTSMENFSRDPASFTDKWTPEQKAKLKALSEKLPQPILNHH